MGEDSSLLSCTKQTWKLLVFYAGALFTASATVWTELNAGVYAEQDHAILQLCVGAIGVAFFVFPCVSIRCPRCNAKWFWLTLAKFRVGKRNTWLLSRTACPQCGTTCGHFLRDQRGLYTEKSGTTRE